MGVICTNLANELGHHLVDFHQISWVIGFRIPFLPTFRWFRPHFRLRQAAKLADSVLRLALGPRGPQGAQGTRENLGEAKGMGY